MNRQIRNSVRALQMENLEQRIALAGNVVIATDGTNLAIVGDADNNQIEMRTVDPTGVLAIVGHADTRLVVDGQLIPPDQPVLVGPVTGVANVSLADGNDLLIISGARLGPTWVSGGAGADVVLTSGSFFAALTMDLGTGNDRFVAHHSIVGGPLQVDGGTGNDHVVLANTQANAAAFDLGAGEDRLRIADAYFGQLGVDLGEDSDVLILARTHVAGLAALSGGADADALIVAGGNHLAQLHVGHFEFVKAWWMAGESIAAEQSI